MAIGALSYISCTSKGSLMALAIAIDGIDSVSIKLLYRNYEHWYSSTVYHSLNNTHIDKASQSRSRNLQYQCHNLAIRIMRMLPNLADVSRGSLLVLDSNVWPWLSLSINSNIRVFCHKSGFADPTVTVPQTLTQTKQVECPKLGCTGMICHLPWNWCNTMLSFLMLLPTSRW